MSPITELGCPVAARESSAEFIAETDEEEEEAETRVTRVEDDDEDEDERALGVAA